MNNKHCEICGITRTKQRALAIHHKDGNHANNNPDNLSMLCASCHPRLHCELSANEYATNHPVVTGEDLIKQRLSHRKRKFNSKQDVDLYKRFVNSRTQKVRRHWSREVGVGFLASEIQNITANGMKITISFKEQGTKPIVAKPSEFNLSETDEIIHWIQDNKCKIIRPKYV